MQKIDWNKLQPYREGNKKSFEELCYQIVSEKFKKEIIDGAALTSVDDSGGGDGVEFYITMSNGEVYGWQSKFFDRLNEGGRKEQIKKSLQTSYKKHLALKKWFLCSKSNFTPDEKSWFEDDLSNTTKNNEKVLPDDSDVELIHWGESELLECLKDYPAIHKFFFSEKLLTQEWFKDRYDIDIEKSQIKAKYNSDIHIPTDIDDAINKVLGGVRLVEILEKEMKNHQVVMYSKEYKAAFSEFLSKDVEVEYKNIQTEFRKFLHDKGDVIEQGINKLNEIKQSILEKDERGLENKIIDYKRYIGDLRDFYNEYDDLSESDLCKPISYVRDNQEELPLQDQKVDRKWFDIIERRFSKFFLKNKKREYRIPLQKKESEENRKRKQARDVLFKPLYALDEYAISSLKSCLEVFEIIDENELHISGNAGMGKTHVSFNIYKDLIINQNQPAIFIFAKDIGGNDVLENQLKSIFGVSADWSFDDFLSALNVAAKANRIKIPIIIDGLNESLYWNSVWKDGLENLIIKIKQKHTHLVLVTTYRTSYEDQLFPDNYFDSKSFENWYKLKKRVRGFENMTWDAINIYFEFYKIKLVNRSHAIGDFNHPLYLKIFCETKNPVRDREVKVSFQNEDLFEVFDEYIKNSNKNITKILHSLDPKYNIGFTENKLIELSEYIWEHNSRGMPRLENLFDNDELRVFEGENLLIFRDWNKNKNKEEIQFTYDLLGGYFISKYLIMKYKDSYPIVKIDSDNFFIKAIKAGFDTLIQERGTRLLGSILSKVNSKVGSGNPLVRFTKSREFKRKLLNVKAEHPLFDDVLRSLSILLIKESGIFLFDVLNDSRAKKYSRESLFEINPEYIKKNENVIKGFLKTEFIGNDKVLLLGLAENIDLDDSHPLNFNFWSDLLNGLSLVERDLSWSEYVRSHRLSYGSSYFSGFVNNFENACKKEENLSGRIHIAARKVMWVLTTNNRRLRDESTRSLYYYARKYPKEFLELLDYSLDINDPYVPERMLAVSYGLAMARQNDFEDDSYKKEWLPKYGKYIFDNLFSKEAKHTTTHILTRDYAKRTIDIALLHNPDLLNDDEKALIQYPLKKYPHQDWVGSINRNKGKYGDGNTPIHMDFENYTIGGLIDGRSNYDSEHNEYKEVLSQIYSRIYDLGYELKKFSEVDKQIARSDYRRHENVGKTDRYGKKYSWIAFFEMAGYRSDLGLLKGWDDEDEFRISEVDVDPSFPVELKQYDLLDDLGGANFLGDETKSSDVWCDVDSDLNVNNYINIQNGFDRDTEYEWVLLKGHIAQKNKEDQTRDVSIVMNAVLMNDENHKTVSELITKYNDYTFGYIRNVENHYLFEGEISWCDLVPECYSQNFKIMFNYRDVTKTKKNLKVLNNGKELTEDEKSNLRDKEEELSDKYTEKLYGKDFVIKLPFHHNHNDDELITKAAEELGYIAAEIDVEYIETENDVIEISMETTIFENSWESYHSEIIPNGKTQSPSKEICNNLGLFIQPQSSDFYNEDGEIVSTSFKCGEGYDNTSAFTYIRKDYLDNYLKERNKKILWIQWAEKRYFRNGVKQVDYSNEIGNSGYKEYHKIVL